MKEIPKQNQRSYEVILNFLLFLLPVVGPDQLKVTLAARIQIDSTWRRLIAFSKVWEF